MEDNNNIRFPKHRNILVTGASGFIGMHLLEQLSGSGAHVRAVIHKNPLKLNFDNVISVRADLLRAADCDKITKGIDFLFHAAGPVSGAGISTDAMISNIVKNLTMTVNLLRAAAKSSVKRFLLFSSSTVYPALKRPVAEKNIWKGPVHPSYFGYGWMRRYFELFGEFVSVKTGMDVLIVRPTAVYGRWDNFSKQTSHVIPALIRRVTVGENPLRVWGSGNEKRDFLHASDLARGCLQMMKNGKTSDPVNLGFGKSFSVREIVEIITEKLNYHGKIIYDWSKPVTIPFRAVDISKARKILGFEPRVSLRNGIADTIEWFRGIKEKR